MTAAARLLRAVAVTLPERSGLRVRSMSFRRGTPWVCRMVLGILAVLSGAAMIPLALLARPAGSLALGTGRDHKLATSA